MISSSTQPGRPGCSITRPEMQRKGKVSTPPEGFRYQAEVLPLEEERQLAGQIRRLPLREFEFHGYAGKRRVLSFGWHYDFADGRLHPAEEIPSFLLGVQQRAAAFAGLEAGGLPHALVTEYSPGPRSAGTGIRGSSTKWLASPSLRHAPFASGAGTAPPGSVTP